MRVDFARRLKPEFHCSKITKEVGRLAYLKLDDVFGPFDLVEALWSDVRRDQDTRRLPTSLLTNAILQEKISNLLTQPIGRPSKYVRVHHASFSYLATIWGAVSLAITAALKHPKSGNRAKKREPAGRDYA